MAVQLTTAELAALPPEIGSVEVARLNVGGRRVNVSCVLPAAPARQLQCTAAVDGIITP